MESSSGSSSSSDRSPVLEERSNARVDHPPQHHHQLGKLQMLPALPAIVLVVESIEDFQGRGGLGGAGGAGPGSDGGGDSSPRYSSTSTSSIGASDLGENVDESSEVESSLRDSSGPLERMDALESSLPLKRGLSQFFDGKSRSFTSLKDVSSATQLRKPEHPFKRRKLVMHSQMRSRAKSSSNLRKMLNRSGGEGWSPPRFVSVSTFLPRSFSLSNVLQQQNV